jgi:hypothetical protein
MPTEEQAWFSTGHAPPWVEPKERKHPFLEKPFPFTALEFKVTANMTLHEES